MFWTDNHKQSFIFLVPCFLLGLLVKWDHCYLKIKKRLLRCFYFDIVWSTVIKFDPELFRCVCKKCSGYLALCLNLVLGWRGLLVQYSSSRTPLAEYSKGFVFAHTAWLRLIFFFLLMLLFRLVTKRVFCSCYCKAVPKPQFSDYCKLHLVLSFYFTFCQPFSLSCSIVFCFSKVPSSKAFLEGFWHSEVEGTDNSCR